MLLFLVSVQMKRLFWLFWSNICLHLLFSQKIQCGWAGCIVTPGRSLKITSQKHTYKPQIMSHKNSSLGRLIYNDFGCRSSFWPIGHRFDGDLICMRKTQNCPLHTHIHGNGHQVCRNTMYQCLSCHLLKLSEQEALWCVSSTLFQIKFAII